jgi:hypothetical protein
VALVDLVVVVVGLVNKGEVLQFMVAMVDLVVVVVVLVLAV